jgi:hypothetical protein
MDEKLTWNPIWLKVDKKLALYHLFKGSVAFACLLM